MCTIAINAASVVAVPIGGNSGTAQISLSGTVANCTSNSIKVEVACNGITTGQGVAVITGGTTWTASVPSKCACGKPVTITATCNDSPPCLATLSNLTIICTCCPTVSTDPICVEYNSSGQAFVKFRTTVNVPSGCAPVTVQRDFGDGFLGTPKIYTSQSQPDTEIHIYSTSSVGHIYTSIVNILSPPSCPPSPTTTVTISQPPPCATTAFFAAICRILQFAFLLSGATAIVFSIAKLFGCAAVSASLVGGLAASAVLFLLIIWAACRDCVCGFLLKLFGQLLIVIGVLLSMFIIQPTCLQLALGTLTPLTWIIVVTVAVLYFGYLVLHGLWYGQGCCPVTICEFWQAVIFAMTVAFVAVPVVYLVLTVGVQALGLVLALLLANAIMTFAGIQINLSQNANLC